MFTDQIHWSLLQGIAWFLVFMFIFRFHPKHALALGVATFVVVAGMATLGIDSLSGNTAAATRAIRKPSKPLRRPATSFGAPSDKAQPSKEGETPQEKAPETAAPK